MSVDQKINDQFHNSMLQDEQNESELFDEEASKPHCETLVGITTDILSLGDLLNEMNDMHMI